MVWAIIRWNSLLITHLTPAQVIAESRLSGSTHRNGIWRWWVWSGRTACPCRPCWRPWRGTRTSCPRSGRQWCPTPRCQGCICPPPSRCWISPVEKVSRDLEVRRFTKGISCYRTHVMERRLERRFNLSFGFCAHPLLFLFVMCTLCWQNKLNWTELNVILNIIKRMLILISIVDTPLRDHFLATEKAADLELDDVSGDGGTAIGFRLCPLEVGVVLVPVSQLNTARLTRLICKQH